MKVFVSHDERHDHKLAHALAGRLIDAGIEPLIASQRRRPGVSVDEKIKAMIEEADCVVVFATTYGNKNQWVQQEIGLARALDKHIIPLTTRGVRLRGVLGDLVEYLQITRKDPHPQFTVLLGALEEYADEHRIPVRKSGTGAGDDAQILHLPHSLRCPECGLIENHYWLCYLCGHWVCTGCGATVPPDARV